MIFRALLYDLKHMFIILQSCILEYRPRRSLIRFSLSLRQFDAASCHAIPQSLYPMLRAERIFWMKLDKSTTAFSQVVDTGGYFRSLKAAIRSGGFSHTRGGSNAFMQHTGPVSSTTDFWILYKNLLDQYSVLDQWCRLGFSWKQSDFRKQKVPISERGLNSRVAALYQESLEEPADVLEIQEFIESSGA